MYAWFCNIIFTFSWRVLVHLMVIRVALESGEINLSWPFGGKHSFHDVNVVIEFVSAGCRSRQEDKFSPLCILYDHNPDTLKIEAVFLFETHKQTATPTWYNSRVINSWLYNCVYSIGVLTRAQPFLFRLPPDRVEDYEPEEHRVYDTAYRTGLSDHDCSDIYSDCPFSLMDVLLGTPQYE